MSGPTQKCPRCGKDSLVYNRAEARWQCFDPKCGYRDR